MPARRVAGPVVPVEEGFRQFILAKLQAESLDKEAEKYKKTLKDVFAVRTDDTSETGSKFIWFGQTVKAMGKVFRGMELRKRQGTDIFNDVEAEKILKRLGLYEQALTSFLDQDKILVLHAEKKISVAQLNKMYTTPEPTWAFYPVEGESYTEECNTPTIRGGSSAEW